MYQPSAKDDQQALQLVVTHVIKTSKPEQEPIQNRSASTPTTIVLIILILVLALFIIMGLTIFAMAVLN